MHPEIARAWSVLLIRAVCNVLPRAWLLAVSGAVSVVFGALLLAQPAIALVTLVYLVAAAALAFGIMAIVPALHLRRLTLERGTPLA
jgi:uncharacterized membrane protein HdeD (DUF308 family)